MQQSHAVMSFSARKEYFYGELSKDLDEKLDEFCGIGTIRRAFYEHHLLGLFELELFEIRSLMFIGENSERFKINIMKQYLMETVASKLSDTGEFYLILNFLVNKYKEFVLYRDLIFNILYQYLYYKYDPLSLNFLGYVLNNKYLNTEKFQPKKFQFSNDCFIYILIQILAFISFDSSKKFIDYQFEILDYEESVRVSYILKNMDYIDIFNFDLCDKVEFSHLINSYKLHQSYKRLVIRNMSNCLEALGSLLVFRYIENDPSRVIYNENNCKKKSSAMFALEEFNKYGITLRERTFWDFYDKNYTVYSYIYHKFNDKLSKNISMQSDAKFNYFYGWVNLALLLQDCTA